MREILSFTKTQLLSDEVCHTEGYKVFLKSGTVLIDTMSGLWCSPLGYSNIAIKNAITTQLESNPYQSNFLGFHNQISEEYAEALCNLTNMHRVYFTNSGSSAVETAIKIATHIKKNNFCAVAKYSYHGSSVLSASASDQSINNWPTVNNPLNVLKFNSAEELHDILKNNVGFIIIEPIIAAGGVYKHSYEIFELLKEYQAAGGIVIFDEVVTGFGKYKTMFAKDHYNFEPDIIVLGKAMSNGYFPLAACLVSENISTQLKFFNHGYTFSGHPVGSAAGLAMIKELKKINIDYSKFNKKITNDKIKEHRIAGCMGAIEFYKKTDSLRFVNMIRNNGYIVENASENLNSVVYCLPYIMTTHDFNNFINISKDIINDHL
jgi:adenosylmethionine-8-amino-7-oxononanoate aminotransferase